MSDTSTPQATRWDDAESLIRWADETRLAATGLAWSARHRTEGDRLEGEAVETVTNLVESALTELESALQSLSADNVEVIAKRAATEQDARPGRSSRRARRWRRQTALARA